jgi:hypothetical protein
MRTALVIILTCLCGCGLIPRPSLPAAPTLNVVDAAKAAVVDKDGKTKPISKLEEERDAAVQARAALDAQIAALDAAIKEQELAQQRRWLIAISVISFLGALICLGIMVAWPNPLLVTLERIGVGVFGAVGGGAWFASMLLHYLGWIFGGICVLVAFFIVRYIVTGRKLGASTQVAADLVDKVESGIVGPALEQLGPAGEALKTRLSDFKSDAKSSQIVGGFWHMTDALRNKFDDLHTKA